VLALRSERAALLAQLAKYQDGSGGSDEASDAALGDAKMHGRGMSSRGEGSGETARQLGSGLLRPSDEAPDEAPGEAGLASAAGAADAASPPRGGSSSRRLAERHARLGVSLDRPPTSAPACSGRGGGRGSSGGGRDSSGGGGGGGRGSSGGGRDSSGGGGRGGRGLRAVAPEWASTKPGKKVVNKVARQDVRVSALETRVDALETGFGYHAARAPGLLVSSPRHRLPNPPVAAGTAAAAARAPALRGRGLSRSVGRPDAPGPGAQAHAARPIVARSRGPRGGSSGGGSRPRPLVAEGAQELPPHSTPETRQGPVPSMHFKEAVVCRVPA
jgi:hypothetical protein